MRDENADDGDDAQFASFTTDDGDTVVYDRHNPAAWIRSTFVVEVGSGRADGTNA